MLQLRVAFLGLLLGIAYAPQVSACDACSCPFNAKRQHGRSAGATVLTPSANMLGKGHGTVGFLFEQQRYNAIPARDAHTLHHDGRDVHGKNHEELYHVSAGYGVTDRFDVFVVAPVVSRTSIQIDSHSALGRGERSDGLGDLRVVGKYRFWEDGVDAAALLGVKTPTGETSDRDQAGAKFEAEQQPGSGSWDVTAGVAASRSFWRQVTLASAFQYTYRGEGAQDHKAGDVFRWDLGTSYALRPIGSHPNLSVVLELHSQWAQQDRSRGQRKVFDSGGTTVLLSPGVAADLTESVSAFLAVPVPVYQNLGGEHEELKYELLAGVSWHF
ncbi:MAG: hypothetical protein COV75_08440 [Candidatus Omnitrophica bacterium CG11_big_fil_rev_8_21_14_0_20_63_9]|nr:MAG: hypothetical protein COV75_08440 [Candidatus Omnitrophica bacterium CG11_big_fil_rev_8_21_14_0_20_63_9]